MSKNEKSAINEIKQKLGLNITSVNGSRISVSQLSNLKEEIERQISSFCDIEFLAKSIVRNDSIENAESFVSRCDNQGIDYLINNYGTPYDENEDYVYGCKLFGEEDLAQYIYDYAVEFLDEEIG